MIGMIDIHKMRPVLFFLVNTMQININKKLAADIKQANVDTSNTLMAQKTCLTKTNVAAVIPNNCLYLLFKLINKR